MAWFRLGLALLAVPSAVLAYYSDRHGLAIAAAAGAALLGLTILVRSVRRQRVPVPLADASIAPAAAQVLLTAASVLLMALSAAVLVLQ